MILRGKEVKMEKEQIIRALECCTSGKPCRECEYKDKSKDTFGCRKKCLKDALALIKELTEENERLNDELKKRPKKLVITKLNTEDEKK